MFFVRAIARRWRWWWWWRVVTLISIELFALIWKVYLSWKSPFEWIIFHNIFFQSVLLYFKWTDWLTEWRLNSAKLRSESWERWQRSQIAEIISNSSILYRTVNMFNAVAWKNYYFSAQFLKFIVQISNLP